MNKKSSNFNLALWLGVGQFSSFALAFVSAAILSRYFDKTEYGTYRQILYVYTTLQTVFTVGLPTVFIYFIPRLSHGQSKTLVNSLNGVLLILGLFFSLSLFFLSAPIANLLNNPELAIGLKYFAPFPLFTIPAMGVEGIYMALRKTKQIAYYMAASKLFMLLCLTLPVVLLQGNYLIAIFGWGIASFISFLVAMYLKNKPYLKVKKESIPKMYHTVFNYSLPLMAATLAGVALNSADQFFISRYYGTVDFAEFSNGAISIPIIGMVAGSVKGVLTPILSKADSEGTMAEAISVYTRAVIKSVTVVFPILIFCMFFAGELVVFVYGAKYEASKGFLRMYMIREFFNVIPYFSVILALGHSRIYFYMHVVGVLFVWLADYIVVQFGLPPTVIVLVRSSFAAFGAFYVFSYIYKKTQLNLISAKLLKTLLIIILHSTLALIVAQIVKNIFMVEWKAIYILVVSGILFYAILVSTGKLLKINYLEALTMTTKNRKFGNG